MKLSSIQKMSFLVAAELVAVSSAADCSDPVGNSDTTYYPGVTTNRCFEIIHDSLDDNKPTGAFVCHFNGGVMMEGQKDCSGADPNHRTSHLSEALGNIYDQCLNSGRNGCRAAQQTGTWKLDNQWYWLNWNIQRDTSRNVLHCGLKARDGLVDGGTSGPDAASVSVGSIMTKNVTRDELPFPEMYADQPSDQLYELTTVELVEE
ncbi:hypothetical protein NQ176_g749 [Zarea fungicola]|uniref:Uncharacterized protein n=1 Tax=Zarea fungicola TaxID=93591 RepID=A0ACC1NVL8_9HYPO|nr:hypothetical protein NQ176_g749 [Lecanicillium fungicola]